MRDQRPCGEFRSWRDMLADPLTELVMQADQVDPARLATLLAGIERHRPPAAARPADARAA